MKRTLAGLLLAACALMTPVAATPAAAAQAPPVVSATLNLPAAIGPEAPNAPDGANAPDEPGPVIDLDINGTDGKPSSSIIVFLAITVLSIAPSLLLMTTAFTKIFVVMSITRNALGLQAVPPNQVMAGLALFLTIFIMAPVFSDVNDTGVQPYLDGQLSQSEAFDEGSRPIRDFMLNHTRPEDLALITRAADRPNPDNREEVPLDTIIPAFVLSELRAGFIIGFVIFVPFLIIDIVVASALMSMGMMMLPPITVSLPFKLLLFVLVDGWSLIVQALVGSYG